MQGFGEKLLVGNKGKTSGTVQFLLEIVGIADADNETLGDGAALLYLPSHLADTALAVVKAVGDDKDDVAGLFVAGEILQCVGESRIGSAAAVGYEGLDFALELVVVVSFKGYFKP